MSVIALVVAVMLVVAVLAVHEVGHALAAKTLGLPCRLTVTRHGVGMVIGSNRILLTRRQVAFTAAAGPAANVAVAVAAARAGLPAEVGVLNLFFAVGNLIPFPHSDGLLILRAARKGSPMLKNITITFDDNLERGLFRKIASASILGGPEEDEKGAYPRVRLVGRAAQGDALRAVDLAALKQVLEEATAEREANIEAALAEGNETLASAFRAWLPALGEAWALTCDAEAVALGGAA